MSKPAKSAKGEFDFISDCHVTKLVGDSYRVYEDASEYSRDSVKIIKLGRYERDAYGNPVQFASVGAADQWVKGGKIIHPTVQFGIQKIS
jgi:hypothetical protein